MVMTVIMVDLLNSSYNSVRVVNDLHGERETRLCAVCTNQLPSNNDLDRRVHLLYFELSVVSVRDAFLYRTNDPTVVTAVTVRQGVWDGDSVEYQAIHLRVQGGRVVFCSELDLHVHSLSFLEHTGKLGAGGHLYIEHVTHVSCTVVI